MKILNCHLIGRFGNCAIQYCAARGIAEEFGAQLRTPAWVGQKIFQLNDPPIQEQSSVKSDEHNLVATDGICDLHSYCQNQTACDFYSRSDVKRWFVWRPEILKLLHENVSTPCVLVHLRHGDYKELNYPMVSKEGAVKFLKSIGEDYYNIISEEAPTVCGKFQNELAWVPDFWKLVNAEILLRGNSSFSFFAAILAQESQVVYSPVIDGLKGGSEYEVEWRLGNSAKLADLPFITEMNLRP